MRLMFLAFLFLSLNQLLFSQSKQIGQIEGQIIDGRTKQPITYANVVAVGRDTFWGGVSDLDGHFSIALPVGRYLLKASYLGYGDFLLNDILVSSHQSALVVIPLEESAFDLEEVVVKPFIDKKRARNPFSLVSGRLLSVEEANRYAGGFDDPARLASAFAGVSSQVGNNGIAVRGNAPQYLQWKLEGVEIPNPNHFANLSVFGGGGLTALSSQVMDNTDFLTGAMPSSYSNALSGVFDLTMRTGSTEDHHYSVQVGLIGLDASSEGPISQTSNSSYLFNYRYSTLAAIQGLLPEEAQGISYQDLSFKCSFPNLKKGTIEWWGIGLLDQSGQQAVRDPTLQTYEQDLLAQDARQYMMASGVKYFKYFDNKREQVVKSQLAFTQSSTKLQTTKLNANNVLQPENMIFNGQSDLSLHGSINSKISKNHLNETGVRLKLLAYDLALSEAFSSGSLEKLVQARGGSFLMTGYSNSSFALSTKTQLIGGFSTQYFALNKELIVEPRLSMSHQASENFRLGVGYGLHSRMEPLHFYFSRDAAGRDQNRRLKFSKAHHLVLNFQWNPSSLYLVKIEPYYQLIFDVPVTGETGFSFINLKNDWFIREALDNEGKGKNIGIDLTVERYISKGLYWLVSASLYDSKFNIKDNPWQSTAFNNHFLANLLIGKEFNLGKAGNKLLSLNYRSTFSGGQPYTAYDLPQSLEAQEVIYELSDPFAQRFEPSLIHHITANFTVNRPKVSHHWSLKILNAGGYQEFIDFRVNNRTRQIVAYREALVIPNFSYKLAF